MRCAFVWIIVLAAIYSGYWALGRAGVTRALDYMDRTQPGFAYQARSVTGYPARFAMSWDAPRLTGPGYDISAPAARAYALSYRPDGVTAQITGPLRLIVPEGVVTLDMADLHGVVRVRPGTDLAVKHADLLLAQAALSVNGQTMLTLPRLEVTLHPATDGTADLRIAAEAPTGPLGRGFDSVTVDAQALLDSPLSLRSPPRLRRIDLRAADLRAGAGQLTLSGDLTPRGNGLLDGTLRLQGQDWQQVLDAAMEAGLLEPGITETWRGLGLRAGSADRLDLTLPVRGGRVMLGPVPIVILPALPQA